MKELVMKVYYRIYYRYLDYRYKIPENAGLCFAYYLIMSIVPICSILAFLASLSNIDLSKLYDFIRNYLTDDFAAIIIGALQSKEVSASAMISIAVSFWVVSRGIHQLYQITKNLFPADHERNFIVERIITIFKTIFVFFLLLLIISLLGVMPFIGQLSPMNRIAIFNDLYLFVLFFIILFLLYCIIPDSKVHYYDVFIGAVVSSGLLTILLALLRLYFSISNYDNVYGSFASVAIVLFSFNYIAEVIYIGLYVMFEQHMKRLNNQLRKEMEALDAQKNTEQKA